MNIPSQNLCCDSNVIDKLNNTINKLTNIIDHVEKNSIMNSAFEIKPSWSMINHEKLSKSYGILNYYVVEIASDSDSDKYNKDFSEDDFSDDENLKEPTVDIVCKNMIDKETIMYLNDSEFPKRVRPGLIFENSNNINKIKLEEIFNSIYYEDVNLKVEINELRNFNYSNTNYTLVFFNKTDEHICKFIFRYYNDNAKFSNCSVKLCYDLTDLRNSKWYSIVIRNIPTLMNDEHLLEFLNSNVDSGKISYLLPSKNIGTSKCSIAVLDNIEIAERLCVKLNKTVIDSKIIKLHIHPKSCRIRPSISHYNFALKKKLAKPSVSRIPMSPAFSIYRNENFDDVRSTREIFSPRSYQNHSINYNDMNNSRLNILLERK